MRNGNKHLRTKGIEADFFEMDQNNRTALIRLKFEKPAEIFEPDVITKTPKMSEAFLEWITWSFDYVPDDYRLDIRVFLKDLEGYREDELTEICKKNILLETSSYRRKVWRLNRLALSLCALGMVIIFAYVGVNLWWDSDSIAKEIVIFVMDIAATVPFWSAADIYFVKNGEQRKKAANFARRLQAVTFHRQE